MNILQYEEKRIINFGMFELHCDELIRALIKRIESMINNIIEKMKSEHLKNTKAYILNVFKSCRISYTVYHIPYLLFNNFLKFLNFYEIIKRFFLIPPF